MQKITIIAEVGPNHNADFKKALRLIDVAKKCGADIVKFQTSVPELHISSFAKQAEYQKKNSKAKTQLDMANKITLPLSDTKKLMKYCKKKKIEFLSTPYDLRSVKNLEEANVKKYKLSSADIDNYPLLKAVAKTNKDIIFSIGMAKMSEILRAYRFFKKNSKGKISILHCTSEYPASDKSLNLNYLKTLMKKFSCPIGYSDHSIGNEAAIASVSLGSKIIEKHITLDKKLPGPDHKASMNPSEFRDFVKSIRKVEIMLGKNERIISKIEKKNFKIARKSIVASKNIKKGEKFSIDNITTKRPHGGIDPMRYEQILNKKAKKNFNKDEFIKI